MQADSCNKLPPGYTWQNLKDLVRPKASHSVWTDVAINFRSQPSSQKGYVKLKLRDETAAAYSERIGNANGCSPLMMMG